MLELVDPELLTLVGSVTGVRSAVAWRAPVAGERRARPRHRRRHRSRRVRGARSGMAGSSTRRRRQSDRSSSPSTGAGRSSTIIESHGTPSSSRASSTLREARPARRPPAAAAQRLRAGRGSRPASASPTSNTPTCSSPPDAPEDAAARLLDAACRLPGCDGLHLLKVRDDSALAPLLAARDAIRSNEDAAPFRRSRAFPRLQGLPRDASTPRRARTCATRATAWRATESLRIAC